MSYVFLINRNIMSKAEISYLSQNFMSRRAVAEAQPVPEEASMCHYNVSSTERNFIISLSI